MAFRRALKKERLCLWFDLVARVIPVHLNGRNDVFVLNAA
jgi:hypothetical protein